MLVLAACGGTGPGVSKGEDLANGKKLFIEGKDGQASCGSCHTLADAGTQGKVGPNLDDAFRGSREQGFEESTFEQVVREQMAFPGIGLGMPPDLVTGKDADDVAAYIARCAGNPDAAEECPPAPSGGGGG